MTPPTVPSRADLHFRPAGPEDAALVARMTLDWLPDEPWDPVVTEYYWRHPDPDAERERFVVEAGGRPIGFGWHVHVEWAKNVERWAAMEGFLVPAAATPARHEALFSFLADRARAAGALVVTTDVWETQTADLAALLAVGFTRERYSKAWELDLAANQERLLALAEPAARALRAAGLECHSIAEDQDPDIWRRAYACHLEADEDRPRSDPFIAPDFEKFMRSWTSPDSAPEWHLLVKEGPLVLAVSTLHFPPVQGNVWTGFTGVARSGRGRGLAKAVKLEIVSRAIAAGVRRIRTDNDETNGPMLHINGLLGYSRIPGIVTLMRR